MTTGPTRRAVLSAAAVIPVASVLARSRALAASTATSYRFLTAHQAAVVVEATARLVPGPLDDPAELGHPGAREADVVQFVDNLLSAFDDEVPRVFAGGPWSDRPAGGADFMATFVPLEQRQLLAWQSRVTGLRTAVPAAVVALDQAAQQDGFTDFLAAPAVEKDRILAALTAEREVLFALTIDALYSVPEYGGNAGLSGWQEIRWPGDVQPVGYTPEEVARDDGPDPVAAADLPVVQELLAVLGSLGG